MFAASLLFWLLAFAPTALSCSPSKLVPGGCQLAPTAGVTVHYKLLPDAISMALEAETPGYVAVAFAPAGQRAMFPADAIVGWAGTTNAVTAYQLNGYLPMDVRASGVVLRNASAVQIGGTTTVRFTRQLAAGRYPLTNLRDVTMNVAQGDTDGLTEHTQKGTIRADLIAGAPRPDPPPASSNTTEAALTLLVAIAAAVACMSMC